MRYYVFTCVIFCVILYVTAFTRVILRCVILLVAITSMIIEGTQGWRAMMPETALQ